MRTRSDVSCADRTGVIPILVLAGSYCLLVGYFIRRIIDEGPQDRRTAAIAFALAMSLFGSILWFLLVAAFW